MCRKTRSHAAAVIRGGRGPYVHEPGETDPVEGQLEDSDISVRELSTLKAVLKSYLGQLYHERVVYPHRKQ